MSHHPAGDRRIGVHISSFIAEFHGWIERIREYRVEAALRETLLENPLSQNPSTGDTPSSDSRATGANPRMVKTAIILSGVAIVAVVVLIAMLAGGAFTTKTSEVAETTTSAPAAPSPAATAAPSPSAAPDSDPANQPAKEPVEETSKPKPDTATSPTNKASSTRTTPAGLSQQTARTECETAAAASGGMNWDGVGVVEKVEGDVWFMKAPVLDGPAHTYAKCKVGGSESAPNVVWFETH